MYNLTINRNFREGKKMMWTQLVELQKEQKELNVVTAGVAGARFRPTIPAVVLLVLHSGYARG
jgi:hypothetical protein